MNFTAVFQQVPEGYIGFAEELPGANTQGKTLDEARANLREAIELVLETNRVLREKSRQDETLSASPFDWELRETTGSAPPPRTERLRVPP